MDYGSSWDEHLHLVEFSYNSNYYFEIQITSFEALYGKRCTSSLYWDELGEKKLLGPRMIQWEIEIIQFIHKMLLTTHN